MKRQQVLPIVVGLVALGCAVLIAWLSVLPAGVQAQQGANVPPPSKTVIDPPTDEPPTDKPPTDEPPTDEPPTDEPPTDEPPTDEPSGGSKPDPACQSAVEGRVTNAAAEPVAGATVKLDGDEWSRGIMTDDDGRYGFAGLCAGAATLTAVLSDGQVTHVTTVELDGQNKAVINLGVAQPQAAATTPAGTEPATAPQPAEGTSDSEANMPQTGYTGWLLAGGAALGTLLLLAAGVRRLFNPRSRG